MSDLITREPFGRQAIAEGSTVSMHFTILLESGEQVDTTRDGRPATFVVGDGNLPPGFEQHLIGLVPGDDRRFEIKPEDAFGPHREENIQWLPEGRFGEMDLEVGLMVSFAQADGELPGVVRSIENGRVEVDFNHPLAGKRLLFDVSIIGVGETENAADS